MVNLKRPRSEEMPWNHFLVRPPHASRHRSIQVVSGSDQKTFDFSSRSGLWRNLAYQPKGILGGYVPVDVEGLQQLRVARLGPACQFT